MGVDTQKKISNVPQQTNCKQGFNGKNNGTQKKYWILSDMKAREGLKTFDASGDVWTSVNTIKSLSEPRSDHEPVYAELVLRS